MAGEVTDLNLCIGSGACILVLLVALALQVIARPYPYAFQNTLEVLLILASILVVVLGLVYTFILKSSLLIEAILLSVLLGSLVGGFAYLVIKHCRGHAGSPARPDAPNARKGHQKAAAGPSHATPATPRGGSGVGCGGIGGPQLSEMAKSSRQPGGLLSRVTNRSSEGSGTASLNTTLRDGAPTGPVPRGGNNHEMRRVGSLQSTEL